MEKIKVSVIIPVYNTENYLRACLDSVVNQTLRDIEIICVNDGSTDNSLSILKEYAQKDSRIVLINQKNAGVSAARNNAIAVAKGEYLAFLDSDDWFEPDAMEVAYSKISQDKTDVVVFAWKIYYENKFCNEVNTGIIEKFLNSTNSLDDFIKLSALVWDKLFKTEFIRKHNILFPDGITVTEDGIFCNLVQFSGAKYSYLNKCLANHNDLRPKSATSEFSDAIKAHLNSFKYLFSLPIFQKQDRKLQLRLVNKYCGGATYFWTRINDEKYLACLYNDINNTKEFMEKHYTQKELQKLKNYLKLVKRIKQYKGEFPYNLLSKTKFRTFKQFRVLGIEWKVPLKKQT